MKLPLRALALLLAFAATIGVHQSRGQEKSDDECSRTAQSEVYSNAWVSSETGDLNGFELAFATSSGSNRTALLYVYEGGESEGIPLNVIGNGENVKVQGTWNEHLVEYPSHREIVQKHAVVITGTLTPQTFVGAIAIEGMDITNPHRLHLKHVKQIWPCSKH